MKKIIGIFLVLFAITTIIIVIVIPRKDTIIIAAFGDYSGGEGTFQDLGYKGMLLAVDELNELDSKRQFALEKVDVSVYTSGNEIDSRLEELNIDIIIGPYLSSTLVTYGDYLLNCGYTVFVPSATYDNISNIDDHVFRFMTSTSNQAHQTAEALDRLGYEDVYFMYDTVNQSYSKELTDYIVADDSFSDKNYDIHELSDYAYDFTSEITSNFDVIYICASAETAAHTINNLRISGIEQPVILSPWSDNGVLIEELNIDVSNVYLYTTGKISNTVNNLIFTNAFYAKYGYQSAVPSLYSYEIVYVINALTGEGKFSQDTIESHLNELESYNGKFNKYYNLGNGDFYSYMGYKEVHNGAFININENDIE